MLANFHTHCKFCDGSGEPREYVEAAIRQGFTALGFSCHAPIPFESSWTMPVGHEAEYLDAIAALKEAYQGTIEIYTGFEVDYFKGDTRNVFTKYPVDYLIGSVHFFADLQKKYCYSIDGSTAEFEETLAQLFDGDIRKFAAAYYGAMAEMVAQHRPTVLGHLDVIKKNNGKGKYFSETENWYQALVDQFLAVVKRSGCIVEVNTGGITRGYIDQTYPSPWILKKCCQLGIPVMVSSDAHAPENLAAFFELATTNLKEAGYSEQMVLLQNKWEKVKL